MSVDTLLINGCSHSAGSEIEASGIGEGKFNRDNCFGAQLANKWNIANINLSQPGGSNDYIANSTALWCLTNTEKVSSTFFLIHWTSPERMDVFTKDSCGKKYMDWIFDSKFGHIHPDHYCPNLPNEDKQYASKLSKYLFINETHWEINKLMNMIKTQTILKSFGAKFRFYNAFDVCSESDRYQQYHNLLDLDTTADLFTENQSFYYWAIANGHSIDGQLYWHHKLPAHTAYANKLYAEIII